MVQGYFGGGVLGYIVGSKYKGLGYIVGSEIYRGFRDIYWVQGYIVS